MNVDIAANAPVADVLDGTELGDLLDDLSGFAWLPGFGQILAGMREAAEAATTGRLTADHTQTALAVCANPDNPDLTAAFAALVQHLTSDRNVALRTFPDDIRSIVAYLGDSHAHDSAQSSPRQHANEAAGLISEAVTR